VTAGSEKTRKSDERDAPCESEKPLLPAHDRW